MTRQQIADRTKTVTRRTGWRFLKVGDELRAVDRVMGFKKGEHPVELGRIRVVDVRREPLGAITQEDVDREGFPGMRTEDFVLMFCRAHRGCTRFTRVVRIEFEYLAGSEEAQL